MSFISYAQNFEDVTLWRALKHVNKGFYVDVGANNPNQDSVTKAFYEKGWRGINIEPVSQWFEKLESERPRDINLKCAAGSQSGEVTLFVIPDTGLSTLDQTIAERHEVEGGYKHVEIKVPVNTLTEICQQYHVEPIHFLKIDVEGAEKEVLKGLDLTRIRPWIVVIESTLPNTQTEDFERWESILLAADYEFNYFDALNRYYVAKEHKELTNSFKLPPNCFDDFQLASNTPYCNYASLKIQQIEDKLATAQAQATQLQQQLDQKTQAITTQKSHLTEQKKYNQWLKTEYDDAKARLETSAAKLATAQAQAAQLQTEYDDAKAIVDKLNEGNHHWRSTADNLTKELEKARIRLNQKEVQFQRLQNKQNVLTKKVNELNDLSHHWWTIADGVSHELQTIYHSKFWYITWPLRKLMQILKELLQWLYHTIVWLTRFSSRAAQWLVVKLMRFFNKRPTLKVKIKTWLKNYPRLESTLRKLVQGKITTFSNHNIYLVNDVSLPDLEVSDLTPNARRIYRELKKVMNTVNEASN